MTLAFLLIVDMSHFETALLEVRLCVVYECNLIVATRGCLKLLQVVPAFGAKSDQLELCTRNGWVRMFCEYSRPT